MTSLRRAERQSWILAALLSISLLALLVSSAFAVKEMVDARTQNLKYQGIITQQARDVQCIAEWTDAYAQRDEGLRTIAEKRDSAINAIARAVARHDQAALDKALADYLAADKAYHAAVKKNPPPPLPKFKCETRPKAFQPITITVTPPPKIVTRTVSAPGPKVPGPTVHVAVPGPTVTRTGPPCKPQPCDKRPTTTVTVTASPTCTVQVGKVCVVR